MTYIFIHSHTHGSPFKPTHRWTRLPQLEENITSSTTTLAGDDALLPWFDDDDASKEGDDAPQQPQLQQRQEEERASAAASTAAAADRLAPPTQAHVEEHEELLKELFADLPDLATALRCVVCVWGGRWGLLGWLVG